jgi:hypothetical protein
MLVPEELNVFPGKSNKKEKLYKMKKIMGIMLGLSLAIGAVSVAFSAPKPDDTTTTKKAKKSKKKSTDTTK